MSDDKLRLMLKLRLVLLFNNVCSGNRGGLVVAVQLWASCDSLLYFTVLSCGTNVRLTCSHARKLPFHRGRVSLGLHVFLWFPGEG